MSRPRKPAITGGHLSADTFVCPKCKTQWERNPHYKAILENQNLIAYMMNNEKIIDYCGKCNHLVYKD